MTGSVTEMSNVHRVYVDFQNVDPAGRVRLNCAGTARDLARQRVELCKGLRLTLYSDDADDAGRPDPLETQGVVAYSDDEECWVASIDWDALYHASQRTRPKRPPATAS